MYSLVLKLRRLFLSNTTDRRRTATVDSTSNGSGEDHISALPNSLLSEIVSRLRITDAIHTTTLSHGWSGVWHSAPLNLDDSQLRRRPGEERALDELSNAAMVARVSSILSSHPGPFRSVRLTCTGMGSHREALNSWFGAFAAKHLEELSFLSLQHPDNVTVPGDLFRCESLRRLHLGGVRLPAEAAGIISRAGHGHILRELREICLYRCILQGSDVETLLSCSPKLEELSLVSSSSCGRPLRMRVHSHSLRCMLYWVSSPEELDVSAPPLERLILWNDDTLQWSGCKKIMIRSAPRLRVIGHLSPGDHVLQIGDTVIKNGMKASATTVVPSVEVLAMTVRFGLRKEEQMSIAHTQSNDEDNMEFWKNVDSIQCVRSSIKKIIFDDFSGEECELAFLTSIAQNANLLEEIYIIPSKKDFSAG
ncbi:uncharacterized protein LOC102699646 [Oryza brachyantha]|nr:uncharacterized protein LOC102699646 [Oryza brachyantha]